MHDNKLRRWLEATGTTQLQLAARTKIPQTQLTKYVNGHIVPGVRNAFLIEDATNGEVDARSWARPRSKKKVA